MVQQRTVGSSSWSSALARSQQVLRELEDLKGKNGEKRKKKKRKKRLSRPRLVSGCCLRVHGPPSSTHCLVLQWIHVPASVQDALLGRLPHTFHIEVTRWVFGLVLWFWWLLLHFFCRDGLLPEQQSLFPGCHVADCLSWELFVGTAHPVFVRTGLRIFPLCLSGRLSLMRRCFLRCIGSVWCSPCEIPGECGAKSRAHEVLRQLFLVPGSVQTAQKTVWSWSPLGGGGERRESDSQVFCHPNGPTHDIDTTSAPPPPPPKPFLASVPFVCGVLLKQL